VLRCAGLFWSLRCPFGCAQGFGLRPQARRRDGPFDSFALLSPSGQALRRKEGKSLFAYPALAPQRALRALSAVPGYYHTSLAGLGFFKARAFRSFIKERKFPEFSFAALKRSSSTEHSRGAVPQQKPTAGGSLHPRHAKTGPAWGPRAVPQVYGCAMGLTAHPGIEESSCFRYLFVL